MRLGIYGGTFDPPHMGHLILAETARDSLQLDRVLFVPAGNPPHKDTGSIRAEADHRVTMVGLAITDNDHFALSRVDVDRPGPHYSVDMLARLMGHADIAVLRQYLDVSISDLRTAHRDHGMV